MKNCILKYLDPLPVTKVVDSQSFLFQKFKHSWSILDIELRGSLKNSEIPKLPEGFCGNMLQKKLHSGVGSVAERTKGVTVRMCAGKKKKMATFSNLFAGMYFFILLDGNMSSVRISLI